MTSYRYCPLCGAGLTVRRLHGQDRQICAQGDCSFVYWGNPVPVVAGIVERANRVILVRAQGWPEDWYGLVTGFLEIGEKPEDAVLREVYEELGIDVRHGHFVGAYPFEQLNQIIFTYHVYGEDGPIHLCQEELTAYKEVPIEKLRPWSRGTGPALQDWLASRGYYPSLLEQPSPSNRKEGDMPQ